MPQTIYTGTPGTKPQHLRSKDPTALVSAPTTGRRLVTYGVIVNPSSGTSITFDLKLKVGGEYYLVESAVTLAAGDSYVFGALGEAVTLQADNLPLPGVTDSAGQALVIVITSSAAINQRYPPDTVWSWTDFA